MVQAVCRTPLAPLADGLGGHAVALGEDAAALMGAGDLGTGDRRGAGVRMDLQHRSDLPLSGLDQTVEQVAIRDNSMPHRIPTMFRDLTASVLIEGYVTDVMMRLDFPMPPDGGPEIDGAQAFLTEVDGAVGARRPHPIRRIFVPGQAGDTGRGDDQFLPVGTETAGNIKGLDPAPLLTAVSNLVFDLAPIDGWAMVRELFQGVKKGRLVAFDLSKDIAIALRSGAEGLLLAIHRIAGIDHAGEAEMEDQGRHARNFVGLAVDLKMGEDDLLGDRERAQRMHRLAIVDMVEASPERLAIQRDERQSFLGGAVAHEMLRIAAHGRLKRLATDRMQEQAHRVDRRRTLELAAEHLVENLPTLAHENDNMGKTLRTRQNRQDAEQKKIRQREAPSLGTARIGNCTQSINQAGIGDHGILTSCKVPQSDPCFPVFASTTWAVLPNLIDESCTCIGAT